MKQILNTLLVVLFLGGLSSCSSSVSNEKKNSKKEHDDKTLSYSDTTVIENQIWTKNLNTRTFRNGDSIPLVSDPRQWYEMGVAKQPACCYVSNNSNLGLSYGLLYNFYAVNDIRGLAPVGFHVASESDWMQLHFNLGGNEAAKYAMISAIEWQNELPEHAPPFIPSRFNVLFGGYRDDFGNFKPAGKSTRYWTSTPSSSDYARFIDMNQGNPFELNGWHKSRGHYVRCVMDSLPQEN